MGAGTSGGRHAGQSRRRRTAVDAAGAALRQPVERPLRSARGMGGRTLYLAGGPDGRCPPRGARCRGRAHHPATVLRPVPAMTPTSYPDAEALYRSLRDHVKAMLPADAHATADDRGRQWSIAGIHSGGAWIAERLAADLGLPNHGVINVAF